MILILILNHFGKVILSLILNCFRNDFTQHYKVVSIRLLVRLVIFEGCTKQKRMELDSTRSAFLLTHTIIIIQIHCVL